MKYKAHLFAGVFVFFLLLSVLKACNMVFSIEKLIIFLASSLLGALIPDIDAEKSKIHKVIYFVLVIIGVSIIINSLKIIELFYGIAVILLAIAMKKLKHRKFFHSMKFGIMFGIFIGIISEFYFNTFLPAFFFFLGFFSHLILDKMV